ncbi:MAG: hypothetical protein HZY73_07885 [Micropruina sp.]|nr:MAG: hypothetical protein HZY73_07885 [Micropruina sp.]
MVHAVMHGREGHDLPLAVVVGQGEDLHVPDRTTLTGEHVACGEVVERVTVAHPHGLERDVRYAALSVSAARSTTCANVAKRAVVHVDNTASSTCAYATRPPS